MKQKFLSLILITGVIMTSVMTTSVAYADTPEDNFGNPNYGSLEEQSQMPGVSFTDYNGSFIGNKSVAPKYIVASFRCLNGIINIDSSVYVGYKYITAGDAVLTVQAALKSLGYNVGKLDGLFGPNTHQAIINFQKNSGLSADATVGPNTWKKLGARCSGKTLPIYISKNFNLELE